MSEQTGTSLTILTQGPSLVCNEGYPAGFAYHFFHGRCNAASTGVCFSAAYTAFSRSSLTGTTSKNCQVLTDMSAVSHYVLNSATFMSSSLKKTQVQLTSIYFTLAAPAGQTQDISWTYGLYRAVESKLGTANETAVPQSGLQQNHKRA
jgi:hypothetical protein